MTSTMSSWSTRTAVEALRYRRTRLDPSAWARCVLIAIAGSMGAGAPPRRVGASGRGISSVLVPVPVRVPGCVSRPGRRRAGASPGATVVVLCS